MGNGADGSGIAKMTLVALFISVLVLTVHDHMMHEQDAKIAKAVNDQFEHHQDRVQKLEQKVKEIEAKAGQAQ